MESNQLIPNEINIKNYKKGKRISKGGFGTIYEVKDKKTGVYYAAKIIDCNDDEETCNKMVNREIGIMFLAKHPTIIKFFGYSKIDLHDENNVTIIMELAKNGSLETVLTKIRDSIGPGEYTNTSRQIIITGVARAMKFLHDRNIIHRDLKPGNVLLDEDLHPHVTDFGMSKIYDIGHSKSQSSYGGTLAYEAPEILQKKPYNGKVDVYSFAILMYEVITELIPYPDLQNNKLANYDFSRKVVTNDYRPEFTVPIKTTIKELIEKCWSKDPNERPNFNEIFDKLSNKDKSGDYIITDDVDMDDFNLYVEDITEITDPIEKLLDKIRIIEAEKSKLENENMALKATNQQQLDKIASIEKEKEKLKATNKKQLDKIASFEKGNDKLKIANEQHDENNNSHNQSMLEIIDEKTNDKLKKDDAISENGLFKQYKVALPVNYVQKVFLMDERKHFIQEYEILKYFNHPNIIQTFGLFFGDENNPPYILLQYIPHNLKDSIKDMNEKQKACIILEICFAMEAVHKAKLIHCGLEPENILIDEQKHVHLTGFSSSIFTSDVDHEKSAFHGSFLFMAPEILNEEKYDEKADVYSFGTVLFFILSGKIPKVSLTDRIKGKFPKFSNISEVSVKLIKRCWSNEPKKRPSFTEIIEYIKINISDIIPKGNLSKNLESYQINKNDDSNRPLNVVPFFFSRYFIDVRNVRICNKIAEGCDGSVYMGIIPASMENPEISCAVKYIKPSVINSLEDIKRFFNEIMIHASLKHIGITPFIGYSVPFMQIGDYSLITKYMPNGSLYGLIRKVGSGEAPEDWETIRAKCIFGIAACMAYIHQNNIIFGDLKSQNVVLDENYIPRLIDFGLAKNYKKGTPKVLNVIPSIYTAPELFIDVYYENKVDVYSYAMILYEIMANKTPYSDKNFSKLDIIKGLRPVILDREIPDDYTELISQCWDSQPNVRPSFIQIVKRFLDYKDVYFDLSLIDEEEFEDFIEEAIQGLDFSVLENTDEE